MWLGWVDTQLVDPVLHFSYYGFDWVKPLSREGMYAVFGVMCFSTIGIVLGWRYRISALIFFLGFTYVELIDITYYLNHYYFVSIVSFLLIWVPAHRKYSVDVYQNPELLLDKVPQWCIGIFNFQIALVYVYAGLAKINYDWLVKALPLSIWLPAKTSLPIIGSIFKYKLTAYLFSWAGMLFDTFIIGGLLLKKTRKIAYLAVILFHTMTGLLFQIGIFPLVMIMVVTIFFSPQWHERVLQRLDGLFAERKNAQARRNQLWHNQKRGVMFPFLLLFFGLQLVFPWRYLSYPGNVFWTEEGYRFAWRVMLMEKAGTATFYVKDGPEGREGSVLNREFLNPHQEKQMAMQPDLILQFAHYLKQHFKSKGMNNPEVRAEVWVTLNARPAKLLIDPNADLTRVTDGWASKKWILPYQN